MVRPEEHPPNVLHAKNYGDEDCTLNSPFAPGLRETEKIRVLEADLLRVVNAWPTLPVAFKSGILAMIAAAKT